MDKMANKIIIDLDDTISFKLKDQEYENAHPRVDVIARMHDYRQMGYKICIFTSRNMRSFDGNVGMINVHTLPVIVAWLNRYDVPYDELLVGKPWCGQHGFYVDDRALRPSEFVTLSPEEALCLFSKC